MTPELHSISPPCLLLTATVQVREDIRLTARRDTGTRLNDYKQAFEQWVANPKVSSIVFVENSGFDLSAFEAIARNAPEKRVEFISFECPPFDGGVGGKSYGEMLCIERCLQDSQLLKAAPSFLKVTGRYYVANINSLIDFIAAHPEYTAVCNFFRNLTWGDSRVFGGSLDLLSRYLYPMRGLIDENADLGIEQVLARAIHQVMADGGKWTSTPETLQIHGVSGTLGNSWTPGALERFKQKIRHRVLSNLLAR